MRRHIWLIDELGGSETCRVCGATRELFMLKPCGPITLDGKRQPYCPGEKPKP